MKRFLLPVLALGVFASLASAQLSRLEGTVTDPQGAAVPGAQIRVTNAQTALALDTTSDDRGFWVFSAMPAAVYKVTASSTGFKTANLDNVKLEVGVPATLNIKLEIGQLTETVEVRGGTEVLQTVTATVSSTLVGRQLNELPFTSRNLTELLVTQAGTSVPGIPRNLSINGLPQSTLNITMDGINIRDNLNSSADLYTPIFARADAIEEMNVSTAAQGADSNAEGAAQVRLVTRRGANDWHGAAFWQHRNTALNANYYYNNINGLPRERVILNQAGGLIGGPIVRNKLFFFAHYEAFRFPQTYRSPTQNHLTAEALSGIFRYRDTANGQIRSINLYQLAAAGNGALAANVRPFATTPDPVVLSTLNRIAEIAATGGVFTSRADVNDYNRNNYTFQTPGGNNRDFPTMRLDWNVTPNHQLEFVYNYPKNFRRPDGLNNNIPILPGTGIVLGAEAIGGQGGNNFATVVALRSTLSPRLTSELRFGLTGGTVVFNDGVSPADFAPWGGVAPQFGFATNPYRVTGQSRRNTPVKQAYANFNYTMPKHLLS
ncbi:MAG: carboxypeptidase regulatory-like domain-containing protein, partial [Bryobacteraceae bacterium]